MYTWKNFEFRMNSAFLFFIIFKMDYDAMTRKFQDKNQFPSKSIRSLKYTKKRRLNWYLWKRINAQSHFNIFQLATKKKPNEVVSCQIVAHHWKFCNEICQIDPKKHDIPMEFSSRIWMFPNWALNRDNENVHEHLPGSDAHWNFCDVFFMHANGNWF